MAAKTPDDVLRFWFPDKPLKTHGARMRRMQWWFRGGADVEIISNFSRLLEEAIRGDLDDWCLSARSRLALIIVLDQFSRTVYRGTALAYAQDPHARSLTRTGLQNGHYDSLTDVWERTFFIQPLAHSERLEDLDIAVAVADEIVRDAAAEDRVVLEYLAGQVREHREVVARFGRHPQRNAILGRSSTPAEQEYLARTAFLQAREPSH